MVLFYVTLVSDQSDAVHVVMAMRDKYLDLVWSHSKPLTG